MIEKIYIPTLNRSELQITWDNMPTFVQDITTLVVQPHEKNLHGDKPILVLPEDNYGITKTRKWIYDHAGDIEYGVFDDDLKFVDRNPGYGIELSKEDADESHQNDFDNEFYEDVFLPYYWKNPFIEGFYQSSGDPGSEEFFYSFIRYFDPITGELCEIQFASYPNNFKKYEITLIDNSEIIELNTTECIFKQSFKIIIIYSILTIFIFVVLKLINLRTFDALNFSFCTFQPL